MAETGPGVWVWVWVWVCWVGCMYRRAGSYTFTGGVGSVTRGGTRGLGVDGNGIKIGWDITVTGLVGKIDSRNQGV
jgi:hypothetical protein